MATTKPTNPNEVIEFIPFDKIDPSPFNPRKTFDEKRLDELALSISAQGINQPLIVRPITGKRYQIVFGERRWRAGQKAKPNPPIWEGGKASCIVRPMTDEEAKERQLTENLQRDDLHPMEEAEAYEDILKHPDYNTEKLAAKLGKQRSYIEKRINFLTLITPMRKLFLGGDIGWEQAEQFSRMIPIVQVSMLKHFDNGKEIPKASEIKKLIEEHVFLDLASAPFDINDENLVAKAGACKDCQKRTGFNRLLFDDVTKSDFCLDRPCFNGKVNALITIQLNGSGDNAPKPVPISSQRHHLTAQEKEGLPPNTLTREDNFTILKKQTECDHAELAVIVHGDGKGKTAFVCRTKSCKEHGERHRQDLSSTGTGESTAERARRLKKDREEKQGKETRRTILIGIGEKTDELGRQEIQQICRALFSRLYNELQRKMLNVLGYMRDKKSGETWDDLFDDGFSQLKGQALNRVVVMLSLATSMDGLAFGQKDDILMEFATRYRVNIDKIKKDVAAKYEKSETKPTLKGASTAPAKTKKKAAASK